MMFDKLNKIMGKPDGRLSPEAMLHNTYPRMKEYLIQDLIIKATLAGFLVTDVQTKIDELTGNELIYLIKWTRV